MIIVEPCAGLGNRLLGLGSAWQVARKLNRELIVLWKREVGCSVKSTELFSLPMQVVEISENGFKREPLAHLKSSRIKGKYRGQASRFMECEDVERVKREEGYEGLLRVIEREPVIYMKTYGPICELSAESYAFLKPSPAVEEKGADLFAQLNGHTVGVHVRRTDHTDAIANSPLTLFAEQMKAELAADVETGFFVATDDESVKRELRELLPDAGLIFNEHGIIDRNSREGLEDALVEMLALSRCRKILGSYNSTFSLLPSYIGNIPLETVKKGEGIYMADRKCCKILGTRVLVTNMEDTVQTIERELSALRGEYICVGNVHTTVMAHDDAHYRRVQDNAAFVLPDGKPLSIYSRKHGFPEAERVTGPDLMLALFARDNGLRHYFYGSTPETLSLLEKKLREKYPKLQIAGMVSPPFRTLTKAEDMAEIEKINDSAADIIWVGLGAPKQENWMYEHKGRVCGVMIGVGAGFDYHAGNIKRAPAWMQRLSLEWLYRLLQDPKRLFKRYVVTNTRYLWLIHRREKK